MTKKEIKERLEQINILIEKRQQKKAADEIAYIQENYMDILEMPEKTNNFSYYNSSIENVNNCLIKDVWEKFIKLYSGDAPNKEDEMRQIIIDLQHLITSTKTIGEICKGIYKVYILTGNEEYNLCQLNENIPVLKEGWSITQLYSLYNKTPELTKTRANLVGIITINRDRNKIQIKFDDVPDKETLVKIKKYGYRWNNGCKLWQIDITDENIANIKALKKDFGWSAKDSIKDVTLIKNKDLPSLPEKGTETGKKKKFLLFEEYNKEHQNGEELSVSKEECLDAVMCSIDVISSGENKFLVSNKEKEIIRDMIYAAYNDFSVHNPSITNNGVAYTLSLMKDMIEEGKKSAKKWDYENPEHVSIVKNYFSTMRTLSLQYIPAYVHVMEKKNLGPLTKGILLEIAPNIKDDKDYFFELVDSMERYNVDSRDTFISAVCVEIVTEMYGNYLGEKNKAILKGFEILHSENIIDYMGDMTYKYYCGKYSPDFCEHVYPHRENNQPLCFKDFGEKILIEELSTQKKLFYAYGYIEYEKKLSVEERKEHGLYPDILSQMFDKEKFNDVLKLYENAKKENKKEHIKSKKRDIDKNIRER